MKFETIKSFEKFQVEDSKRIFGGGDDPCKGNTTYKSGPKGGQKDQTNGDGTVSNCDGTKGIIIG